jgi:hypothetical protein
MAVLCHASRDVRRQLWLLCAALLYLNCREPNYARFASFEQLSCRLGSGWYRSLRVHGLRFSSENAHLEPVVGAGQYR